MEPSSNNSYLAFFQQEGDIAQRIRQLDGGRFTHVGLLLDGENLLEAAPPQVRICPLATRTKDSVHVKIFVLPHKPLCNPLQFLSTPYDWGWLSGKVAEVPKSFHCATLIGSMFGLIGPRHPDLSLSELRGFCKELV